MTENLTLKGEALGASLGGTLEAEQFLNESYRLRRNVLNGKVEFLRLVGSKRAELERKTLNAEETYRPLTQEALNSIILRAKREGLFDAGVTKSDFTDYIYSEDVPLFDPTHTRSQFRATGVPEYLAARCGGPLAPDGHPAWERVCTNADWCPGMWQDHLPAPTPTPASSPVLPGPSEPVEQV